MTEAEWLACEHPHEMQMFLADDTANDRKWLFFGARNLRQSVELLTPNEAEWLATVVENLADGLTTHEQVSHTLEGLPNGPTWTHRMLSLVTTESPVVFSAFTTKEAAGGVTRPFEPNTVKRPEDFRLQADAIRCLFGNPFRPTTVRPEWRTGTVLALARQVHESRDFGAMPILADALQDAGCEDEQILGHCRSHGQHVRGCWVVGLVLRPPEKLGLPK